MSGLFPREQQHPEKSLLDPEKHDFTLCRNPKSEIREDGKEMNLQPLTPPLWVCHRCDMRFGYRSRLKKHTTTGACRDVTQKCCVCYEQYERACDLRRHLKERHGHVYPSYLPPPRSKTELARVGISIRGWTRGPPLKNYRLPRTVPAMLEEVRPGRVAVIAPPQPLGRATTLKMMVRLIPPMLEAPSYGEQELARRRAVRRYQPPPPFPRKNNRPDPDSEYEDAVEPEPEPITSRGGRKKAEVVVSPDTDEQNGE